MFRCRPVLPPFVPPTFQPLQVACEQRANRTTRMAKGSRAELEASAKDRRGIRDPGTTGQSRIEVHLEEHGGTAAGIWPK